MTKTAQDVCNEAARMLNLIPEGDAMPAEMFARAGAHLDDILHILNNRYALAFEWDRETVPVGAFLPLARAVAGSICSGYGRDEFASLYAAGIRGMREFAADDLRHDNTVTPAEFF